MISVDVNILVRYAVKDEPQQTIIATDFLAKHSCFVLKTVLLELIWVLGSSSGYALSRELVLKRVKHILGLPNVVMQDADHVAFALDWYEAGMDFADALHLASSSELTAFATFFWFPNSVWESMKGRSASRDAEHRNRHSQPEVGNEKMF